MWTFVLIILTVLFIFLLIKFWPWLVNTLFKTTFKNPQLNKTDKKNDVKVPDHLDLNLSSGQTDTPKSFPFVLNLNERPEWVQDKGLYFLKYLRKDGEWVNKDEPICELSVGQPIAVYHTTVLVAIESGYLEHVLTAEKMLKQNEVLYRIHTKGNYKNEILAEEGVYNHYFNGFHFTFSRWLVSDGDFVRKDETIYQFVDSNKIQKEHKAKIDGYISIYRSNTKMSYLKDHELVYSLYENEALRIEQTFINVPKIINDEFTGAKRIEWAEVSSANKRYWFLSEKIKGVKSTSDDHLTDLLFSFVYQNNSDYILFHFNPKQINLKINDAISFLFENNEKIEFRINTNPISTKNYRNERVIEAKSLITKSELELFASQKLKKWKIYLAGDDKEILGGNTGASELYRSKKFLQIVVQKFAKEYIELVNREITDYKPTYIKEPIKESSIQEDCCYVYLMHDTTNGFTKIGISNKPMYRERTLQSEKPTIEMVISKKFPIRKIAESFEKSLHNTYAEKRIRGEWFELTPEDIEHLKESLT